MDSTGELNNEVNSHWDERHETRNHPIRTESKETGEENEQKKELTGPQGSV